MFPAAPVTFRPSYRLACQRGRTLRTVRFRRLLVEALEDRRLLAFDWPSLLPAVPASALDAGTVSQAADTEATAKATETEVAGTVDAVRPYVAGEVIVAIGESLSAEDYQLPADGVGTPAGLTVSPLAAVTPVLHSRAADGSPVTLVKIQLQPGLDVLETVRQLGLSSRVLWAAPNYAYQGGDPRELVPNDPQYAQQYHHALMRNDLAWNTTQGAGTIVAVTDDGFDWNHEDLAANIWVNADEIPDDGIDNDANGYIDDVHGWDFSSNDNNSRPENGDDHGTHVAGIIAARTNNALGVAGTAGQATIMPIRFYGSGSWTSSVIAASYAYAVDTGARIISASYNVDGFVDGPTFSAALQYVYEHGVLHFNSAGNHNQLNPARQAFEQSLMVASTTEADAKSSFSNCGTGIDLAAPGSQILATLPGNAYGERSGTSAATPNAAAVAALIWSAHPDWTRDQVAAQLLGTAENIDAVNPGYGGLLGAGRVNSYQALTATLPPPRVQSVVGLPPHGGRTTDAVDSLAIHFSQVLDATTADAVANYELREAGRDGVFDTADDFVPALARPSPTSRHRTCLGDIHATSARQRDAGDRRAAGRPATAGSRLDSPRRSARCPLGMDRRQSRPWLRRKSVSTTMARLGLLESLASQEEMHRAWISADSLHRDFRPAASAARRVESRSVSAGRSSSIWNRVSCWPASRQIRRVTSRTASRRRLQPSWQIRGPTG